MIIETLKPITELINKFIPDGAEKNRLQAEVEKASIELDKERIGALGKMLGSQSFFVAGAIPSILWILVLTIFNNYILMPWAALFGATIPDISLPGEVWTLAGWIVTGLLAKKAVDGNAFYSRDGTLLKPSRAEETLNTIPVVKPTAPNKSTSPPMSNLITPETNFRIEPGIEKEEVIVEKNQEYYDQRYEELMSKYKLE